MRQLNLSQHTPHCVKKNYSVGNTEQKDSKENCNKKPFQEKNLKKKNLNGELRLVGCKYKTM